jgi:hypothetical protein
MSSESQRIAEARLIHHRFASVGFRAVLEESMHVKFDPVARASRDDPHDAQRDGRIRQRSGNVGECLAWISFCFGMLSLSTPSGFSHVCQPRRNLDRMRVLVRRP